MFSSNQTFSWLTSTTSRTLFTMVQLIVLLSAVVVTATATADISKRAAQDPPVWTALDQLRGKSRLGNEDIMSVIFNAKSGEDYPNLNSIPEGNFDCNSVKQPGFYADVDTRCQGQNRFHPFPLREAT